MPPADRGAGDLEQCSLFVSQQLLNRYAVLISPVHIPSLFLRRLAACAAPALHSERECPVKAAG
jgi:hypothetical protein